MSWFDVPPRVAVENGHELVYDPGMSCQRWTCERCGMAAIRCGTNEYGRAVERRCEAGE